LIKRVFDRDSDKGGWRERVVARCAEGSSNKKERGNGVEESTREMEGRGYIDILQELVARKCWFWREDREWRDGMDR